MIAIITVLIALPAGFLLPTRLAANTLYAVAYLWAFTYQSVYLVLGYVDGSRDAFRPGEFPLSYGLVAVAIFAAGFGLVALGRFLAGVRSRRRTAASSA